MAHCRLPLLGKERQKTVGEDGPRIVQHCYLAGYIPANSFLICLHGNIRRLRDEYEALAIAREIGELAAEAAENDNNIETITI